MKFHEALGEVIRDERLGQELTLREVAQSGFVSMGHLSDVENGRKEGSSAFIEAVAKSLGLPTYELIIEAGYRMAEIKIPETYEDFIEAHDSIHTTTH